MLGDDSDDDGSDDDDDDDDDTVRSDDACHCYILKPLAPLRIKPRDP